MDLRPVGVSLVPIMRGRGRLGQFMEDYSAYAKDCDYFEETYYAFMD